MRTCSESVLGSDTENATTILKLDSNMLSASVLALDVDKLYRDWEWMLSELREVLRLSRDTVLAGLLPDANRALQISEAQADSVELTQAYSIAFQLLGMAEQISAAQFRNQIENQSGLRPLDLRLREAWVQVGLKPELIREPLDLPRLTFGTWLEAIVMVTRWSLHKLPRIR